MKYKAHLKIYAFLLALAFTSMSCGNSHRQTKHKIDPEHVYVCTGPTAKRYHSVADCKGLSNCSGSVIEMTIEEAEADYLTPCRMCVDFTE